MRMAVVISNNNDYTNIEDNLISDFFISYQDNFRRDFETALPEVLTGCEVIDIEQAENELRVRIKFTKELLKTGILEKEDAVWVFKGLLGNYLELKIWDFFTNKFIPERAGAGKINQFCRLITGV